jgi:predicted DNA-binding transcriptional regulator YafY
VLTTVAQACRNEERMRFSYTARGAETTERHVEPLKLVSLGRRWYLVAFDVVRDDWRSFRVDRLADPSSTGIRFHPRELPAEDAATFVRAGIESMPAAHAVEVLIHASAATVRTALGRWATVEEAADDRCVLRMTVDSLDWPALALGAVRAEFEVLSPPELVEHIREWGARFTRAAGI